MAGHEHTRETRPDTEKKIQYGLAALHTKRQSLVGFITSFLCHHNSRSQLTASLRLKRQSPLYFTPDPWAIQSSERSWDRPFQGKAVDILFQTLTTHLTESPSDVHANCAPIATSSGTGKSRVVDGLYPYACVGLTLKIPIKLFHFLLPA
jgi:hypothetical protein